MKIRFTKMHGLGNDFVVIDALRQRFIPTEAVARYLGDRHFGVGFDQMLIVERPSRPDVDFRYRIFNADGGEWNSAATAPAASPASWRTSS
jgi:diaminopimelate epimerase